MDSKHLMLALYALVEREGAVSIPQAAQLLGVEEPVVLGLLEDHLLYCYDAVLERLEVGENHAHLVGGRRERVLRLTREETDVLLDALAVYGFGPDDELWRKLRATKGFFGDGAAAAAEAGDAAVVRTVAEKVDAVLVEVLAAACEDEEHHLVALAYAKEGAAVPERRRVEPRMLVVEDGHNYLRAYDVDRAGWRTFRLDRIAGAEVLDETCEPHLDPDVHEERDRAVVEFAGIEEVPADWPGLDPGEPDADGRVRASVPWYGSAWLPKHIVSLLGAATPLEPPELVEACRDYAELLLGAAT